MTVKRSIHSVYKFYQKRASKLVRKHEKQFPPAWWYKQIECVWLCLCEPCASACIPFARSILLTVSLHICACIQGYNNSIEFRLLIISRIQQHMLLAPLTIIDPTTRKNPSTIWDWKFKFFNDDRIVSIQNIDISMLASGKNHLPYKISAHNKGGTVKNGCLLFMIHASRLAWHGLICPLQDVWSEEKKNKLTNDWIPTPRTIIDTRVVNRTFVHSHFNFVQCVCVWILEIQIYRRLLS